MNELNKIYEQHIRESQNSPSYPEVMYPCTIDYALDNQANLSAFFDRCDEICTNMGYVKGNIINPLEFLS